MDVVAVTASGNEGRIKLLAEVSFLPGDLLTKEEVEEIVKVGKTVHFRNYVSPSACSVALTLTTRFVCSVSIWRETLRYRIFQTALPKFGQF